MLTAEEVISRKLRTEPELVLIERIAELEAALRDLRTLVAAGHDHSALKTINRVLADN